MLLLKDKQFQGGKSIFLSTILNKYANKETNELICTCLDIINYTLKDKRSMRCSLDYEQLLHVVTSKRETCFLFKDKLKNSLECSCTLYLNVKMIYYISLGDIFNNMFICTIEMTRCGLETVVFLQPQQELLVKVTQAVELGICLARQLTILSFSHLGQESQG